MQELNCIRCNFYYIIYLLNNEVNNKQKAVNFWHSNFYHFQRDFYFLLLLYNAIFANATIDSCRPHVYIELNGIAFRIINVTHGFGGFLARSLVQFRFSTLTVESRGTRSSRMISCVRSPPQSFRVHHVSRFTVRSGELYKTQCTSAIVAE